MSATTSSTAAGETEQLRRTPLDAEHRALGATMTGFAGWSMPLRYTSDVAEHQAVRSAAGLFDLSHMGQIRVTGPDAGRGLDRALVGNISGLAVGRARYTMICAPDGGVVDDLVVYRTGDEEFLVVANASNATTVTAELQQRCSGATSESGAWVEAGAEARAAAVDEPAGPVDTTTALVAVQGPAAAAILTAVVVDADRDDVAGLRYYACTPARVAVDGGTVEALVARTGYTGEDGFELYCAADDAVALWRSLLAAGEPHGLVPAGLACRDSLRLEAGMPLYGNELDRTTTPYDAGVGRVVRLDKTDDDGSPLPFVGREALEARAHSEPARVLVGLEGLGRRAARHGYAVLAPRGATVGHVTSGAPSPTLGHPVALAYVTPEVSAPGTELAVDVRGRAEPVRVVPLPFYRRAT
ncbi:glycine cleavage system aminomethyltransferase GcvT [Cellulomonas carbonis]|uniref:Aminomethyltransferase n=1 Tax=Cellulomonas carbonis T26 TaxID=947969 RepID=A0A0A0BMT6_9CELL|nr:glycine cleavage system aminomethyltransferase GcvT [Cellulomonas carbonis]KGM09808.1 glycine cleavage system protein T [Cellulomonas carbonis T26]GGC01847.1 aminomethyltransferase [Cellulomonas carbonis]